SGHSSNTRASGSGYPEFHFSLLLEDSAGVTGSGGGDVVADGAEGADHGVDVRVVAHREVLAAPDDSRARIALIDVLLRQVQQDGSGVGPGLGAAQEAADDGFVRSVVPSAVGEQDLPPEIGRAHV